MIHRFAVVDLETTGNSPKNGERIIQFSAVIVEDEKIVDQYSTFLNPEIPIPAFIEELTGINDDMVMDAPAFKEVASEIYELLNERIFVAHNVLFDLNFLKGEFQKAGYPDFHVSTLDTVELAKILLPTADSYKLIELAEYFSFTHERPHQADSDAFVTAEILLKFTGLARSLPLVTLEKLTKLSSALKSNIDMFFSEILNEKMRQIPDLPLDLEVFRGIAVRKEAITDAPHEYRINSSYPHTLEEKEKLISKYIKNYSRRNGQFEMMDIVYDSFEKSRHSVIEAGTGVGKSLAYLLPSIFFAVQSQKKIVISTYTTQLQEQLLLNEMNVVKAMIPFPFKAALLKGRNHYPNMFKFEQSLKEEDLQYDSVLTKMQLLVWFTLTNTGDMDELNLSSGGKLYWNRIKQDGWHLSIKRDPWGQRDFYLRARKKAEHADLIITNHSMLLADIEKENKIFPDYEYVVIDEAHHLERSARQYFGLSLKYVTSKFLLSKAKSSDKQSLLPRLHSILEAYESKLEVEEAHLDSILTSLEEDLDVLFHLLAQLFLKTNKTKQKQYQKLQLRLDSFIQQEPRWKAVQMCAERVVSSLKSARFAISDRIKKAEKDSKTLSEKNQSLIEEAYTFVEEWTKLEKNVRHLFVFPENGTVIWLEGDMRSLPNSLYIRSQPVAVQEPLASKFFGKMKSTVLTSATLTINQSFNFFMEEIGLASFPNVSKKQIDSPFDFQKNAKLIIPNDIPEIRKVSSIEYAEAMASHLIPIAQATKGRMLVLFTAYDLLRLTYDLMKQSGLLDDYLLIAQGISAGSRTKLTKNFQRFEKSILFGMNSFWEGIDIPGEDLSCLVMVRLPFSPPDEPLTEAKNEYMKQKGKNPFSAYALPEAVLRFKQGFGRLIRTEADKGLVIVFDRRIETTAYGKDFIRSIPPVSLHHSSLNEIIQIVEDWL
jgi:ATP-dependent DNA helicase DinG